jgi:hypothetical protein
MKRFLKLILTTTQNLWYSRVNINTTDVQFSLHNTSNNDTVCFGDEFSRDRFSRDEFS